MPGAERTQMLEREREEEARRIREEEASIRAAEQVIVAQQH